VQEDVAVGKGMHMGAVDEQPHFILSLCPWSAIMMRMRDSEGKEGTERNKQI
jgi:hypothetical protein